MTNGSYELRLKASDGSLRSQAVSGFTIPVRAVFDRALNLAEIQKIITQPRSDSSSYRRTE
jgi:hypothetical protein